MGLRHSSPIQSLIADDDVHIRFGVNQDSKNLKHSVAREDRDGDPLSGALVFLFSDCGCTPKVRSRSPKSGKNGLKLPSA